MPELISPEYKAQQETLHENPNYGVASIEYAPIVSQICNKLKVEHLLDYGCGKGRLFEHLKADHKMTLQAYDPAVEQYSSPPIPAEMVACIDVLEHIEPDLLDNVLDDLERLTESVGFFSVSTGPAVKILPDGRNAHLIQQDAEWWLPKFMDRWDLQTFQRTGEHNFFVICYSMKGLIHHGDHH